MTTLKDKKSAKKALKAKKLAQRGTAPAVEDVEPAVWAREPGKRGPMSRDERQQKAAFEAAHAGGNPVADLLAEREATIGRNGKGKNGKGAVAGPSMRNTDNFGRIPASPIPIETLDSTMEQGTVGVLSGKVTRVVIQPPQFDRGIVYIRGSTPYVQHKFSQKAVNMMVERQKAGSQGEKSRRRREPKDFEEIYRLAQHIARDGWHGIPAPAFRNAMIDACRLAGFTMTRAKLSLFIVPDGLDQDGQPLVKINGTPRLHEAPARNASGVADIRHRPMWEKWNAAVTVRWDARQFSATDVVNLMAIAGMQVGVGEGRPSSPNSNGLDWGLWDVVNSNA